MDLAYSQESNPDFENKKYQYSQIAKRLNFQAAYQNLLYLLWQANLPCLETSNSNGGRALLKYCAWKGRSVPCSAIFTSFLTDSGMCCSFNMKAAEDLFVGETFPHLMKTMQSLETQNFLEESEDTQIQGKTQPGKNGGLTVIIDTHKNSLSPASLSVDTGGIIGMIEPGGSYPTSNLGSIDIQTGYNTLIALSGGVTTTSDDLILMDPKERKCLFGQENSDLKIFQHYSQSNCFFECFVTITKLYLEEKYNITDACIPWNYPTADLLPKICDPWEAVEFKDIMSNVPDSKCTHCLPDCTSVNYKVLCHRP